MRSLIAIVVGAAVAAGLFQVGAIVALLVFAGLPLGSSGDPPPVGYFVLNLSLAALAAVLAGKVGARLAGSARGGVVVALALLLAGLALWGFSQPASRWPSWYPPTLAVVGATGTLLGGRLWPARGT